MAKSTGRARPIVGLDVNTNETVEWESISKAAVEIGVNRGTLHKAMRKGYRCSHYKVFPNKAKAEIERLRVVSNENKRYKMDTARAKASLRAAAKKIEIVQGMNLDSFNVDANKLVKEAIGLLVAVTQEKTTAELMQANNMGPMDFDVGEVASIKESKILDGGSEGIDLGELPPEMREALADI